ncbi:unnamed protein product [Bursaphelenchus xylophilus]|uniref:(pine wood nematode) hypothetical protein n=1 Tax=Bursaphelenchus xylophilus TaxID=6326 RepID=A0A1I7RNL7_BURXY|nr:unnamed protein product [Bursaphelenchus xylophilus]CAG9124146.1 unnamed protein product [Bursaphelenchus xylophilus]
MNKSRLLLICIILGVHGEGLKEKIEGIIENKAQKYALSLNSTQKELFLAEANLESKNLTRTRLVMSDQTTYSLLLDLLKESFQSGEVSATATDYLINVLKEWPKVIQDAKDTALYDKLLKEFNGLSKADQDTVNEIYPELIKTLSSSYWNSLLMKLPFPR